MKKLGLFTNYQFDDGLYHVYQDNIKSLVAKRYRSTDSLQIELINVLPQGNDFARDNQTINTGLFESCFRTSLEYAINVRHCNLIALCFRDTYLHSLGEEIYAENDQLASEAQLVSLVDCALTACIKHKRFKNLGLLSASDVREDNYTRERFQDHGYQIVSLFDTDTLASLDRQALIIGRESEPENIDIDQLRLICGTVESAAKVEKINSLLVLGFFELCSVFEHSGLAVPVVNLVEEHVKAIADAILS